MTPEHIQATLAFTILAIAGGVIGSLLWALGKGDGVPGMDADRGYRADDCSDFSED